MNHKICIIDQEFLLWLIIFRDKNSLNQRKSKSIERRDSVMSIFVYIVISNEIIIKLKRQFLPIGWEKHTQQLL